MVYTQAHRYYTVHWQVNAAAIEEGQFGFRLPVSTATSQSSLDTVRGYVETMWAHVDTAIPSQYRFYMLKCAVIGTDGLYPADEEAVISEPASVVPGGGTSVHQFPLQIAHAVSLTTAAVRGRAHRGRIYMPPLGQNLDSNDVWPSTVVAPRVTKVKAMFDSINAHIAGSDTDVAVMSRLGAGTTRRVTGLAAGNRPDVQRRRAAELTETYSTAVLA